MRSAFMRLLMRPDRVSEQPLSRAFIATVGNGAGLTDGVTCLIQPMWDIG